MFDYLRMAYKEYDYTVVIATYHAVQVTQLYNFGAETHLHFGGRDTSALVHR